MTDPIRPLPDEVRRALADAGRLEVLAALDVMDTDKDADFDRLSRIAAHLFDVPFAQVTLIDIDRQWFRACFGIEGLVDTPVEVSFCAHTIAAIDVDHLLVPDMTKDERFSDSQFVVGWPHVRFYAGVPIEVRGQRIGTLCVMGTEPRPAVKPEMIEQLKDLAAVGSALFSLKDEARVRARTAAALIKEEWRHALTLEAGKVGSWVWDIRTGEVSCNDTFRRMYGLAETGVITVDHVMDAIVPADRRTARSALGASFREGIDYKSEVRLSDGGRWVTMRGRIYQRDAKGWPLIMMGASLDVSESKQTAEQTRLLLRELNHRVKNTLAMIQSVARQTIRQNPDPKGFIDAFSGRLRTISDAHVLLADRDWSGVQLYEVVASQLGQNFQEKADRAEVHGDDVTLPADHAVGLGLILHELTTNAHRHGAWSDDDGIVSIEWAVRHEPVRGLELNWREHGGPSVTKPQDYGLGAKLIERSLAKVLDSEVKLSFEPDGVTARVWMPLPAQ